MEHGLSRSETGTHNDGIKHKDLSHRLAGDLNLISLHLIEFIYLSVYFEFFAVILQLFFFLLLTSDPHGSPPLT